MSSYEQVLKRSYGPMWPNLSKPCSFWPWGDVRPLLKPDCHGFRCKILKLKKEDLNKNMIISCFFCSPNHKDTSWRYFERVPQKQNDISHESVRFTIPSLEKSSSEKTVEYYLTNIFINDFANNLNI